MSTKVHVRDIALKAGVSPATVSNALNNRVGVSQEVAQRIRELAKEMGYTPPKAAAAEQSASYIRLILYRSHGLVVMDTSFFSELINSITSECQKAGIELMVTHLEPQRDPMYEERIRTFCSERCLGILLLGTEMSSEELSKFRSTVSPLVVLDNLFPHEQVHSVVMNNFNAGRIAANALYQAGHRKIAHITSTRYMSNFHYRRKGFEASLRKHNLPTGEALYWKVEPTLEGAYKDMKQLLESGKELPTAFFAANDIMAVGCMRALSEKGYRIPEDVSFIGMDDVPLCLACSPTLSTIHVYCHEMGVTAVRTLLNLASNISNCAIKTEISVSLIERNSVLKIENPS